MGITPNLHNLSHAICVNLGYKLSFKETGLAVKQSLCPFY